MAEWLNESLPGLLALLAALLHIRGVLTEAGLRKEIRQLRELRELGGPCPDE